MTSSTDQWHKLLSCWMMERKNKLNEIQFITLEENLLSSESYGFQRFRHLLNFIFLNSFTTKYKMSNDYISRFHYEVTLEIPDKL